MANTIQRLSEVKSRTGLSRSTIYLRISQNSFPRQVSIGDRAAGWIESEIDNWIDAQIHTSREAT
jgi:prophage regulatory protein